MSEAHIETLKGLTLAVVDGAHEGSETMVLTTDTGRRFVFWHKQDCCESVQVAQVDGDPRDLLGSPLLMAEEATDSKRPDDGDCTTWTFYKFATVKGYVTVRWLGTSNGYYSEGVSLREEKAPIALRPE
jgi:hypothetical protein